MEGTLHAVFFFLAAICIKAVVCNTGSCPAQPDVMRGLPEMVDAASTGAIAYTPIPAEQNFGWFTSGRSNDVIWKLCQREGVQEYRKVDGTCNHVFNLGSANTPLRRMLPPVYDDGINAPRSRGVDGFPLPSPSDVSRVIHLTMTLTNAPSCTCSGGSLLIMTSRSPLFPQHVHVHILPRKPGDFEQNDDIYYELQKHDRDMSSKSPGLRSAEEMAKEAAMMRSAVKESL